MRQRGRMTSRRPPLLSQHASLPLRQLGWFKYQLVETSNALRPDEVVSTHKVYDRTRQERYAFV